MTGHLAPSKEYLVKTTKDTLVTDAWQYRNRNGSLVTDTDQKCDTTQDRTQERTQIGVDRLGETSTRRTRAQEICDQHAGLVARLVRCQTVVNRLGHSAPRDTAQEPTQERTQMGEDRLGETSARRTRALDIRDEHAALVAQLERHQGPWSAVR